jgi:cytochrome c-type biogenesis protein CcmH/NrfG
MPTEQNPDPAANGSLAAKNVYVLAVVFLLAGLAAGYLLTGSSPASVPAAAATAPALSGARDAGHPVTMADMKQMADTQAAPLLDKLKSDPDNAGLLAQVGAIYHISHQFSEAATWYGRASQADPTNVGLRTKFAISLYRSEDVDGAIAQLNQALTYDPKDANCLFNLGMIRLQGKGDGKGALAAWQLLLKSNPQLSPDRKAAVQQAIAQVLQNSANPSATGGARNHDGHKSGNK